MTESSTTIFAENFRGFKRLEINIDENTFLVGDNSSGKTSFLHLIDCVSSTDLFGIPRMDNTLNVGRFDFFSPYFNYRDVIIGYYGIDKNKIDARLITLRRLQGKSTISVDAFTCATEFGALTLRARNKNVVARFEHFKSPPNRKDLLTLHKSKSGFKKLSNKQSPISDQSLVIQVLFQLVPELMKDGAEGARLAFETPVPVCRHIGPVRAQPESYYRFDRILQPSGAHFPSLMQDMSDSSLAEVGALTAAFGRESGLFDDIKIQKLTTDVDDPPLQVQITRNNKIFSLNQVGIGVSQVAPIIAETLASHSGLLNGKLFLIQQPELHLHPKAQAALGQYFYEMSKLGITFIAETHSDFLIDRFRSNIKSGKLDKPTNIIYCFSDEKGNHAIPIKISHDGKLLNAPDRYHDFFINELARTMI